MPKNRKPSYLLHRATGQARCRINGRDVYLGVYGTPESKAAYDRIVQNWLADVDPRQTSFRVDELALAFIKYADSYYRHPDGTPTGEAGNMRHALRPLVEVCGRKLLRDFGPRDLKRVRDDMIRRGWCRTNVNRLVNRLKRVFSWGVENEMVDVNVYQSLRCVAALRKGRTEAEESEPVEPVAEGDVSATLAKLPRVVADMVQLQLPGRDRRSTTRGQSAVKLRQTRGAMGCCESWDGIADSGLARQSGLPSRFCCCCSYRALNRKPVTYWLGKLSRFWTPTRGGCKF